MLGVQKNVEEAIEPSCFNGVVNQICVDVVKGLGIVILFMNAVYTDASEFSFFCTILGEIMFL